MNYTTDNGHKWLDTREILIENTRTHIPVWSHLGKSCSLHMRNQPPMRKFHFLTLMHGEHFSRPLHVRNPRFIDSSFQDWKAFRLCRLLVKTCPVREASALICRIFAANVDCLFSGLRVLFCMQKLDICSQCAVESDDVCKEYLSSSYWFGFHPCKVALLPQQRVTIHSESARSFKTSQANVLTP